MKPKIIIGLVIGIISLIVLLQNAEVVSLQFLFWKLSMSQIIFFPVLIFLGFVIGFFVGKKFDDF